MPNTETGILVPLLPLLSCAVLWILIVAVIVVARVVRGVMRRIVVTIWCGILRAMIDHKQAAPLKNHQYDTEEE